MKLWQTGLLTTFILLALNSGRCQSQTGSQTKSDKPQDTKNFVALKEVVTVLESILNQIQAHLKTESNPPIQLQSAEFDFQTITTNDAAGGLLVSIVTAEGEHTRVATRGTTFIYSVSPPAPHAMNSHIGGFTWLTDLFHNLRKTAKPEDFNKTLPAAIIAAADTMNAVRFINSPTGKLTQRSFVITIAFSVTNAFNGGANPSSLITVAPELQYTHSSQNVQTLRLTFADH